MAYATETLVRRYGGLNAADDFNVFRLANDAALTTAINDAITFASAYLQQKLIPGIYTSTDANVLSVLALGETFVALHFLFVPAKARRVVGTHYALETEGSERYEELIDTEFLVIARDLLSGWIQIDVGEGAKSFARPRVRIGTPIDPLQTGFEPIETEIEETLDRARGVPVVLE